MTYQQYVKRYPIRRDRNTGRYGFERVYDCVDLSRCVHASKQAAGKARKESYDYHEANPLLHTMRQLP